MNLQPQKMATWHQQLAANGTRASPNSQAPWARMSQCSPPCRHCVPVSTMWDPGGREVWGGGRRKQIEDSEIIKWGFTFSELQERAVWKWGLDSLANEAAA